MSPLPGHAPGALLRAAPRGCPGLGGLTTSLLWCPHPQAAAPWQELCGEYLPCTTFGCWVYGSLPACKMAFAGKWHSQHPRQIRLPKSFRCKLPTFPAGRCPEGSCSGSGPKREGTRTPHVHVEGCLCPPWVAQFGSQQWLRGHLLLWPWRIPICVLFPHLQREKLGAFVALLRLNKPLLRHGCWKRRVGTKQLCRP